MRSYEERAKDFIKAIFPYIRCCDSHMSMRLAIARFNDENHRNVIYTHGLTRFALINSDYVVKVDFNKRQIANFGGCEKEIRLYNAAVQDGFGYLFAKITRFEYEDNYFYIMPRVRFICSDGFGADAWDYMNEDEVEWCSDHGLFDLHCRNYGWKDHHIVLFDYGAYGWDEE